MGLNERQIAALLHLTEHRRITNRDLQEIAPDVFTLLDDGLAYVKEGDKVFSDPGGAEGLAGFPDGMLDAVVEAAEECPGECIFIEAE